MASETRKEIAEMMINEIRNGPEGLRFLQTIGYPDEEDNFCFAIMDLNTIKMYYTNATISLPRTLDKYFEYYLKYLRFLNGEEFVFEDPLGEAKKLRKVHIHRVSKIRYLHFPMEDSYNNYTHVLYDFGKIKISSATFNSITIIRKYEAQVSNLEKSNQEMHGMLEKLTNFMEAHLAFMPEGEYAEAAKEDWNRITQSESS